MLISLIHTTNQFYVILILHVDQNKRE